MTAVPDDLRAADRATDAVGASSVVTTATEVPARLAAGACGPLAPRLHALAEDVWWMPGAGGRPAAANRGAVANLLLARHAGRLWLIGSGPSPAFARALRCRVRGELGQDIAEVMNPYARAELVLGNAGMGAARVRAPAVVVQAMARQCPACVQRLRGQLGPAASDLGAAPVRLPAPLAPGEGRAGERAQWGPFEYEVVPRGAASAASVWRHPAAGVVAAWGLVWFDGAPDGSDTEPSSMITALDAVLATAGVADRVLGEAGPLGSREDVVRHREYWNRLWQAAQAGVRRGATWPDAAVQQAAPAAWLLDERHALNAQRAWRLAEDEMLALPGR
ncbi:MAG: hypothetical protein JNJ89_12720 [Rubrivivax sp.]|nr:hypothetical protein [Rubrivivax sp.]